MQELPVIDHIGDLARDALGDKSFPRASRSLEEIERYLLHQSACSAALVALNDAWEESKPGRSGRTSIPPSLRFRVLRRDEFRCRLCGHDATDGRKLHLDHKVALARAGTTEYSNLWTLCDLGNLGKGTQPL